MPDPWRNRIIGSGEEAPEQLLANPHNWRIHPKSQQEGLVGVLDDVGWVQRVIVNQRTGHTIDGHLRVTLAMRRDEPSIPVDYVDLSEEEEKIILATLDPLAGLAATDKDKLKELLDSVKTDNAHVKAMLEGIATKEGIDRNGDGVDDPGAEMDKADVLQEHWQVKQGDVWEIPSKSVEGKAHKIMCGDSTSAEDVGRLMKGKKAKLYATDPPYGCNAGNIGFTAQRDDIEAITKDDLQGKEMQAFLESVFSVWIPYLSDDCAWYLWHPMLTQGYFAAAAAAAAADLIIHRQIIWYKEQFIFGRGDYHWRHELCFYGWRKGNRPAFYGDRNQDTVWDISWGEKRSSIGHPTAKPPELFAIPMRNHLKIGELCAEPFLGSGSQLAACEQTRRMGYGMEIEPKYVAVALHRLEGLGLTPHRVNH